MVYVPENICTYVRYMYIDCIYQELVKKGLFRWPLDKTCCGAQDPRLRLLLLGHVADIVAPRENSFAGVRAGGARLRYLFLLGMRLLGSTHFSGWLKGEPKEDHLLWGPARF